MCLAKTKEKITLPGDIMGNLEGRSRYARMGLVIHITSALVQPGSSNHQVLEIVNLAPFPVKLHAGMRISQVVFEQLESKTSKPYAKYGKIARKQ
jgi:dCTP deaminase